MPLAPLPTITTTPRYTFATLTAQRIVSIPFPIFGDGGDCLVLLNGAVQTIGWSLKSPSGSLATLARPITDGFIEFDADTTGLVQVFGRHIPRRATNLTEGAGPSARDFNYEALLDKAILSEFFERMGRTIELPVGIGGAQLFNLDEVKGRILGFDPVTGNVGLYTPILTTIGAGQVVDSNLASMPQGTIKGRAAGAGSGAPGNLTAAQVLALIGLIPNTSLANMPASTVKGSVAGGPPDDLTAAQLRTIIGNVSSATAGLAPASGGGTVNFLRADGTWTSPGDIVLATQQATTSGTQFDFTGLPAGLNEIVVSFDGVSLSGTDHLLVQLGTSGGIEATGYVSTSAFFLASSAIQSANSTTGFVVFVGNAASNNSGQMIIRRMSGNKWTQSHASLLGTTSAANGGGVKTLSGEIDRIRILASGANTFDAGSVNISYTR